MTSPSLTRPSPGPAPPAAASSQQPSTLAIWAALVAIYLIWGGTYLAIRYAIQSVPPFLMAASRFLLAGAVLYIGRRLRGDPRPTAKEWRATAIVGGLLIVGGNGCVVWAEQHVDSGITALLVSTAPFWMALLDMLIPGGRRPRAWVLLGVLVGLGGIALLVWPEQSPGAEQVDRIGAAVLLLGALCWSFGSVLTRKVGLPASPLLATGMEMLAGGAGLLLLGSATGDWGRLNLADVSLPSLLGFAYLVVLSSWVGFTAYAWLLRVAPISLVSTYAYVNPLVALALGAFLGEETLTLRTLVSAAVIVGAVILITVFQSAGNTRKPAARH